MTRSTLLCGLLLLVAACTKPEAPAVPDPKTPELPMTPDPDPMVDPMPDPDPVREPPVFPVETDPFGDAENCAVDQLSRPHSYGNKVKTLLTGMAMTKSELEALEDNPDVLASMIDTWIADPKAEDVFRRFFMMAFQQDQVTGEGLTAMTNMNNTSWGRYDATREDLTPLLIDNLEQSFARTALRLMREGRPFNEVATTDQFEMTTALMMFYGYLDHRHVNDNDTLFSRPLPELTELVGLRNQADEPPADQVLDPSSPNFMHVWLPTFNTLCVDANVNEFTYAVGNNNATKALWMFSVVVGRPETVLNRPANVGLPDAPCRARPARRNPLIAQADFSDWRTVTIRKPGAGEDPIRFYRLAELRATNDLALHSERVGFFTTLGFFATWPTNEDNSSRVTLNQTLITALGNSFDGNTVTDFSPPALDAEHSAPNTACYGCHQTLDPMREFFRQSYSASYGEQHDQARKDLQAIFVFRGVQQNGNGVRDLGNILADHPDFPEAWAQKLCFYANAAACPKSEELARVVGRFRASNLDFKVLLRELFSSPLVTNAACVDEKTGAAPSIARREQFCAVLSNRLGIRDICGIDTPTRSRVAVQNAILPAIVSIPADTFSRGEPLPVTISKTGLFTRASAEVVCTAVGERAFTAFTGLARNVAITKMVEDVMGLADGDPRHDGAIEILRDHVADGVASGASESNALKSALVLACMSPGVAGIGF